VGGRAGGVSRLPSLTPHVRVDLDAVERNIAAMQAYCDAHGLACRPHIKTHKLPKIAHLQCRAGAVGITCQKLGEAEVMAASGLDDILIAYPVVGEANVARVCRLAREVHLSVAADSPAVAEGLSEGLAREGLEIDFLVECDTGLGRTGVQDAEEARALARRVTELPGLRFAGLMTYPTPSRPDALRAAREAIEADGLRVEWVSAGGTQEAARTHELGEVTELRAGTYALGDRGCIAHGSVALEDCAARVRATVVSRPTSGRAILDAGSKALTTDLVEADGVDGYGLIIGRPGARIADVHEEHGFVELDPGEPPLDIGDQVDIVPNHVCGMMNLHDEVVVHRSGREVGVWPVAARGASR
jgi:D-serine deaminase-like pyridoxal phosphate-dependent protein